MATIPLQSSSTPDILDYGFDKSLNRTTTPISSPSVYDIINRTDTGSIQNAGSLTLTNQGLSNFTKVLTSGDDIQVALNALQLSGGGILKLDPGTYNINTALVGYSSISIIGENQSTTILNFTNTSSNLSFSGTKVYTAGTITSIINGVNVTGAGTSWVTQGIDTTYQFYIAQRWYRIAAVLTNTTLTLAEAYDGAATLPGSAYRLAVIQKNLRFNELTLKNSTGTGLAFTDCRNVEIENCSLDSNNIGISMTNVSEILVSLSDANGNTSHGFSATGCGFLDFNSFVCAGNGGNGYTLNTCRTSSVIGSCDSNTLDGVSMTSCSDFYMVQDASSNGAKGIEFVSGNENIVIEGGIIKSNISDGIKLTASSNRIRVATSKITGNGGWGVNIAAASDTNALIIGNYFATNTSGNLIDSGTGDLIADNIGVPDAGTNTTSDWVQLGEVVTSGGNSTLTISGFTARQDLKVIIQAALGTADATRLTFNNDSGANYSTRYSYNGAADATGTALTSITLDTGGSTTNTQYYVIDIGNTASVRKQCVIHGLNGGTAGVATNRTEMMAVWDNVTQQITRVDVFANSGTWVAGGRVSIYGKKD